MVDLQKELNRTPNPSSFAKRIELAILGKSIILTTRDFVFMCGNKYLLPDKNEELEKLEKEMFRNVLGMCCLSVALSLSVQRYFPSKAKALSLNRLIVDLSVGTTCASIGFFISMYSFETDVRALKKGLLQRFEPKFMKYVEDNSRMYDLSYIQQAAYAMKSREEFQAWDLKYRTRTNLVM